MKRKWLIAGILIVAEILLCGGIILISWVGIDKLKEDGLRVRIFHADLVSAEAEEKWQFSTNGTTVLVVESSAGDISIVGGDSDQVSVTAHKTAWHSTNEKAQAELEEMNITVTQTGNNITVRYQQNPKVVIAGSIRNDKVDFSITVPTDTAVTTSTSSGDVFLTDSIGEADLHSEFGDITASNVTGSLIVDSNSGEIVARDISAGKKDIDLRTEFGNIELENSTGDNIEVRTNSGRVELIEVDASNNIMIHSDFGKIEFENGKASRLSIEANSGSISLANLKINGLVDVHSDFGEITLKEVVAGSYDLDTNSGELTVEVASGSIIAHSEFGDIKITEAKNADLDLDTNSGTIEFIGSLGDGPHTLNTEFGNIRLEIPEETALTFEIETDFGKIRSDFPVTLSGELEDDHWVGTINGGGSQLTAK
nr:DUF4097 family beta strand repeat protein [Chloroflexota bacterium]